MRVFCSLSILFVCIITAVSQERPISAEEYSIAFDFAVSETNSRFPFIHTFTSEAYENGKLVSNSLDIAERQSMSKERQTFRRTEAGKETVSYQLRTASGANVYCSNDGKIWSGPQLYECPRSIRIYGPSAPSSTQYWVQDKTIAGKNVKVYRKFEVFGNSGQDSTYAEEVAVISADGLFISTTKTMGTMNPRAVSTKLSNSWKLNAKFSPITVPPSIKWPENNRNKGTTLILNKN
jgi:hypothetical protein